MPSRWHGSEELLRSLGLAPEGPVERERSAPGDEGLRSRHDGEPLRPAGSNGTRTAGVELMFAPPKTVSALWATAGPYRRAQIEAAHRRAVASALARTEREVALVRRKSGGVVRFETAKAAARGGVRPYLQPPGAGPGGERGIPDPQLHSHVVVFAAERHDGKLAAVESRQLYEAARENGAWYRAELAPNLPELGVRYRAAARATASATSSSRASPRSWRALVERASEDVDRAARLFRQRYGREPRAGELGSLTTQHPRLEDRAPGGSTSTRRGGRSARSTD